MKFRENSHFPFLPPPEYTDDVDLKTKVVFWKDF